MDLKNYANDKFERGAPLWKEAFWFLAKIVFFQNAIPWPSTIRVALLRAFGARVGQRVVIRANVNISFPWRLTLGDDVWLGEEVFILSLAEVSVESSVCVSQRAFLCTGSHDFRAPAFDLVIRPIVIRRGSWIAAQAFVAAGVEIGVGSLVSAGSVVLESVPPNSLVRGNPAAVVRSLEGA